MKSVYRHLRLFSATIILFLLLPHSFATPQSESGEDTAAPERAGLTYEESLILGIVEGLTEFLPVSSTGHLIITDHWFEKRSSTPPPIPVEGELLNPRASARHAYLIVIQGGAILAVFLIYREKLISVLFGLFGRNPRGLQLGLKLIVAFLPAAILGPLLNDWIESKLFNPAAVSVALLIGSVLMLAADRRYRSREQSQSASPTSGDDLDQLKYRASLWIGLLQCLAMWPGMSRSMITIVGGYTVGLRPKAAAEFSFLLGFVTLGAASVYSFWGVRDTLLAELSPGPVLTGLVMATVVAFVAVKWFVNFLTRYGLGWFAAYRILLAFVILWIFVL